MSLLPLALALILAGSTAAATAATPLSSSMVALTIATGTFDVKMAPQAADGEAAGPFGRLLLDKQYHGQLEVSARGQMMAFQAATEGSAGHVAPGQVTGTLDGRRGSIVLQHDWLMACGTPQRLSVTVVPDSGTDELASIDGDLQIIFAPEWHRHELTHTLPAGN